MASVNRNTFYKYEYMRLRWSRCFEESGTDHRAAASIKNFFNNFTRNHRNFTFVVGELFDGTTHLLVEPSKYQQIKDEIEAQVGKTLPDLGQLKDVKIIEGRKSFPNFHSFRGFSNTLKEKNDEVGRRRKEDARKSERKLRETLRAKPKALILAFDLEAYEHDHSIILEIGYVITTMDNQEDMRTFHYIIEENLSYVNKDHVPDNRYNFEFGTSERMSLRTAAAKIQEQIKDADFLVTHSGAHDAEFLASCGVSVTGKLMFDTQILATALLEEKVLYGLKRLMVDLGIPFDEDTLHNGGNDAYYTMKVFLALTKRY